MPEFLDLLKALNDEGVKFVVVGGFAMMIYGASAVTYDLDLAIALDDENGAALVRALEPFHPFPPQFGSAENFVWDNRSLVGPVMSLVTSAGHIDILRTLPEVDHFDGLYERSVVRRIGGIDLQIASVDDLILMKQAASRPKDQEHIHQLKLLKLLQSEVND